MSAKQTTCTDGAELRRDICLDREKPCVAAALTVAIGKTASGEIITEELFYNVGDFVRFNTVKSDKRMWHVARVFYHESDLSTRVRLVEYRRLASRGTDDDPVYVLSGRIRNVPASVLVDTTVETRPFLIENRPPPPRNTIATMMLDADDPRMLGRKRMRHEMTTMKKDRSTARTHTREPDAKRRKRSASV